MDPPELVSTKILLPGALLEPVEGNQVQFRNERKFLLFIRERQEVWALFCSSPLVRLWAGCFVDISGSGEGWRVLCSCVDMLITARDFSGWSPASPHTPATIILNRGVVAAVLHLWNSSLKGVQDLCRRHPEQVNWLPQKEKQKVRLVLLPKFYLYFLGIVHGLCQWEFHVVLLSKCLNLLLLK